jgi:hypothetical protein
LKFAAACEDFAERGCGEAQPQHALMPLRLVLGTQPRSDLVAVGRIVCIRGFKILFFIGSFS